MTIFESMQKNVVSPVTIEQATIDSRYLEKEVTIDFFTPGDIADHSQLSLLLINDGQELQSLGLADILNDCFAADTIKPLLCVGIYVGKDRKIDYGISAEADYMGRGINAGRYAAFVIYELLPFVHEKYRTITFHNKGFAGFSLGGLSALDIVWNHPHEFSIAGAFSGSFWWRSLDQFDTEYDDDKHRIMQQQLRRGQYREGLRFFFQCGNMDETMDRNHNGIIDSIDDTLDVINELKVLGYDETRQIMYLEMADGKHDVATWARAMPVFLKWGWRKE